MTSTIDVADPPPGPGLSLTESFNCPPSDPAADPFLDDFLPVASVQSNLDHYVNQWNHDNFIGNILEDIVLVRSGAPTGSDTENQSENKDFLKSSSSASANDSWFVISSDIDSKYNCGYITKYKRIEDIPTSSASLFLNPGYGPCSSIVSLNDSDSKSSIMCGFDSGNVVLFDDNLVIAEVGSFCHNMVTRIRTNPAKTEAFVADLDGRIVLVDLHTFQPVTYLDQAHAGPVNDLQLSSEDSSLLLSAGADNEVLLWDNRCDPDSVTRLTSSSIVVTVSSQPTVLCWSPNSTKQFLFGTEMGNVVHYDLRASKVIQTKSLFNDGPDDSLGGNRIHLIKPVKSSKALAITADQCNQIHFYRPDLSECLHTERYPTDVSIRSCLEIDGNPHENTKSKLISIGTKRSVFVHDQILSKL